MKIHNKSLFSSLSATLSATTWDKKPLSRRVLVAAFSLVALVTLHATMSTTCDQVCAPMNATVIQINHCPAYCGQNIYAGGDECLAAGGTTGINCDDYDPYGNKLFNDVLTTVDYYPGTCQTDGTCLPTSGTPVSIQGHQPTCRTESCGS